MRDSFVFYRSWYEAIQSFPAEVQGEIYTAIFEYSLYGNETHDMGKVASAIWTLIRPQVDANRARYENGCKGGAPKGNRNSSKKNKQRQPRDNLETTEKQPNEYVNEYVCSRAHAREDFSNLPESLQAALSEYFAVRAESGKPVYATQQGLLVAKLLSATGGDFAKAERWVKNAASKNLQDFYTPFDELPDAPKPRDLQKESQIVAEWREKFQKFIDEKGDKNE